MEALPTGGPEPAEPDPVRRLVAIGLRVGGSHAPLGVRLPERPEPSSARREPQPPGAGLVLERAQVEAAGGPEIAGDGVEPGSANLIAGRPSVKRLVPG